ncbi:MAG: hypothetical protein K8S62_15005 [Candidatus Sabulitectum sp.]|nr:hypothetical protein [Candidatus Sabulitectum sp.]
MNLRAELFLFLTFLLLACDNGGMLDSEGLASSGSAFEQFTRASQLYYRGRLTAALEEFNGVIYRYPNSPLVSDARLAVRRVESDLSGEELQEDTSSSPSVNARIAVVGKPSVDASILAVGAALRTIGAGVTEITDDQAPALTVVFYRHGYDVAASVVADSLGRWLSHPDNVAYRPGEELIGTVAQGYDVLVIVGSDAVFAPSIH